MLDRQRRRVVALRLLACLASAAGLGAAGGSLASESSALDADLVGAAVPKIIVVGSTPLPGSDLDRDQVPQSTRVLTADDINRTGIPSLTGALLESVASVSINDTEGNVFQPDILFRGFTASPIAGTPQGLAVYVNGARFNDAFGDTVNWDLIPPVAIQSVNLEAANPLFGLNALGGSVNLRLKDGFGDPITAATAYGGSYGRRAAILEFSRQFGDFAFYAAADATHDGGFRNTSTSDLYRLYTDFGGWHAGAEWHVSFTAAHDTLGNPGAAPEQALAANIANIFTAPNTVDNNYFGVNLNGTYTVSKAIALQTVAYLQTLNQIIPNGITAQAGACGDGTNFLCGSDGSVITGVNRQPLPDFLHGGTYSGLSVQQLNSHAYGLSAQATDSVQLSGMANYLAVGTSFDGSSNHYAGVVELGGFNPYTRQFIGPATVEDDPSTGVNPVRVLSDTRFYGVFATDVLTLAHQLDLTLAARFNDAQVDLEDELGGPVNGSHTYDRLNPNAGLTWRVVPELEFYGNYAETNRAPTPLELSCASAAAPCSLLNFFVGDPNLKQVVAHSVEFGVRGGADGLRWNVDGYHTRSTNDIIYETTVYNPNLAFYTNAGRTIRRGIEADVSYDRQALHLKAGYALTDATFRTPLLLNTLSPAADANGNEQIAPGDRLPGIPRHRANVIIDYDLTHRLSIGASVKAQSSAYRFGDEANRTAPLGGYALLDLNLSYRPVDRLRLFAVVNNVFDKRYYTYGAFGPVGDVPWPNVPGGVTDPRTASPGMPITLYGGLRLTF